MIDEKYIALTLSNLKTIYNRTCKEHGRIVRAIEGNCHQADRVWENAYANERYEEIMVHLDQLEEDKEQIENMKKSIATLLEWCSMNTPKLKE